MRLAYIDCIAGVSGDMLLGALVDAGVAEAALQERLAALALPGFGLTLQRVQKGGIAAVQAEVRVSDHRSERHLPEIIALVENSGVPATIKRRACALFERLGAVEAAIHGTSRERVHLHELGGIDTIVDVVGVLSGFELLGVERVECSPLPLGRGFVNSAHGRSAAAGPRHRGAAAGGAGNRSSRRRGVGHAHRRGAGHRAGGRFRAAAGDDAACHRLRRRQRRP